MASIFLGMIARQTPSNPFLASALLFALAQPAIHAGGACCVVQVSGSQRPQIALSAVHAQSHEEVFGESVGFAQQGLVARLSWPLGLGVSIAATTGAPLRTEVGGSGEGFGGWILGTGLSWSLPRTSPYWSAGTSASATRSEGFLQGSDRWSILEFQGSAHLEGGWSPRTRGYLGARASLGQTEWTRDDRTGSVVSEFHPTFFAGWRESWSRRLATDLEVGAGHGFLLSFGVAVPLR